MPVPPQPLFRARRAGAEGLETQNRVINSLKVLPGISTQLFFISFWQFSTHQHPSTITSDQGGVGPAR